MRDTLIDRVMTINPMTVGPEDPAAAAKTCCNRTAYTTCRS